MTGDLHRVIEGALREIGDVLRRSVDRAALRSGHGLVLLQSVEMGSERRDRRGVLGAPGEVPALARVGVVVVELLRPVAIAREAPALRTHGVVAAPPRRDR